MKGNYVNPYVSSKSSDNKGIVHGSGIRGQVGLKKGSFTDDSQVRPWKSVGKPPRKMN